MKRTLIHGASVNQKLSSADASRIINDVYMDAKQEVVNHFYSNYRKAGVTSAKVVVEAVAYNGEDRVTVRIDKDIIYSKRVVIKDTARVIDLVNGTEIVEVTVAVEEYRNAKGREVTNIYA